MIRECYLIKSGIFIEEIKELSGEGLNQQYNRILEMFSTSNDPFRTTITDFLIPYKISPIKFFLNREYYNGAPIEDIKISPSLRFLMKDTAYLSLAFEDSFYYTFPDVSIWAMSPNGKEMIGAYIQLLQSNNKEIYLTGIVDLYINTTKNELECKHYYFKESSNIGITKDINALSNAVRKSETVQEPNVFKILGVIVAIILVAYAWYHGLKD